MAITKSFDNYKVFYYSQYNDLKCYVYLYQGTSYQGRLAFHEDGSAIPDNAAYSGNPTLNYPVSEFANVMEILREEKPLNITLNEANGIGTLATSQYEPVGEEES